MLTIKIIFWALLGVVLYSYLGYGILLWIIVLIKRIFSNSKETKSNSEPEVTLFIAAFNEKDYIESKVLNSLSLDYPKEKLYHIWVTDGSDDGSEKLLATYPKIKVLHQPERRGKINAMNRGMQDVETPIVIFCDANTMLSENSIRSIVNAFNDEKVGCVSGEKRILNKSTDSAAGSGEGIYWKYESFLKKMDSEIYTTVGAAGEIFAIRTSLFKEVEPDSLLDDFMMSMRIAIDGYKIKYVPEAYATETSSANVKEELKRKVRIAAGVIQSIFRLKQALNPFHNFILFFQYFSHKFLRWIAVPIALPVIYFLNYFLVFRNDFLTCNIYEWLFWIQTIIYLMALFGWVFQSNNIKLKIFFVPYYIFIMNYAMWLGFFRYMKGKQTVNWERAKRAN
jgi:cellulose synthase/poly-beta-1,6-N-acetylglucosamine synthase-like glycosyltransferase